MARKAEKSKKRSSMNQERLSNLRVYSLSKMMFVSIWILTPSLMILGMQKPKKSNLFNNFVFNFILFHYTYYSNIE